MDIFLTAKGLEHAEELLTEADKYARVTSGCKKVAVGSVITDHTIPTSTKVYGSNKSLPISCKHTECLRVQKYGENSKLHRNPEDCRAVHSEVDAICNSAKFGIRTEGKSIFVTRYPCEACARAIVRAGITLVVYGRKQIISEETAKIFEFAGVQVIHCENWDAPDVTY